MNKECCPSPLQLHRRDRVKKLLIALEPRQTDRLARIRYLQPFTRVSDEPIGNRNNRQLVAFEVRTARKRDPEFE